MKIYGAEPVTKLLLLGVQLKKKKILFHINVLFFNDNPSKSTTLWLLLVLKPSPVLLNKILFSVSQMAIWEVTERRPPIGMKALYSAVRDPAQGPRARPSPLRVLLKGG